MMLWNYQGPLATKPKYLLKKTYSDFPINIESCPPNPVPSSTLPLELPLTLSYIFL